MMKKTFFTLPLLLLLVLAPPVQAQNFRAYFEERNRINATDNQSVIRTAHEKFHHAPYVIVDKKKQVATYFSAQGEVLTSSVIKVKSGDELDQGGAGIYVYEGQRSGTHYLKAQKDAQVRSVFQGSLQIPSGVFVYVLPASDDHKFRIRNHILTFNAAQVLRNREAFNYSPFNPQSLQITYSVDEADEFKRTYVRTLEKEKESLMQLLKLEDDEYNMLAEFAYGVLSPETNYGQSLKYQLKQSIPVLVSIAKGNGFDTDENSRGPTQIKDIPDSVEEKYKLTKGTLKYPRNAAIATLAFAAELLKELRNRAPQHDDIREETLQDYLYYLYQGRHQSIIQGTATPDRNIAIRKIKEAITHLNFEYRK
ncbi:hypothetical protein [Bdellovibrio sp. ArHS]|uniref:hypothetical protein n=1 Tax=Bdellovibrio sp. ArHS TaxID=1569284 RepID=UPI000B06C077|nr:hypothetical protein [Bdellovibrio sp. ArHS]